MPELEHSTSVVATPPTHCVFRRGTSWLALPVAAVREAIPRPEIVFVPGATNAVVGLSHVRGEFVPILNLDTVLPEQSDSDGSILLILDDSSGPWAVLVDEVSSLQDLEASDAPVRADSEPASAVVGWATTSGTVVQVLDQSRIRMFAECGQSAFWSEAEPLENSRSASKVGGLR